MRKPCFLVSKGEPFREAFVVFGVDILSKYKVSTCFRVVGSPKAKSFPCVNMFRLSRVLQAYNVFAVVYRGFW